MQLISLLPEVQQHVWLCQLDAEIQRELEQRFSAAVAATELPESLLEALEWEQGHHLSGQCSDTVAQSIHFLSRQKRPSNSGAHPWALFDAMVDMAGRQVSLLRPDDAMQTLALATELAPCIDAIVPREKLRKLYLQKALAQTYRNDADYLNAFIQLLGIDPRVYLEPDYSPEVRAAYLDAASRWSEIAPILIEFDPMISSLWLDGEKITSGATVRQGLHLIQVQKSDGTVRTNWIQIVVTTVYHPDLYALFRIRTRTVVRQHLAAELRQQRIPADVLAYLTSTMTHQPDQKVVFVVEDVDPHRFQMLQFELPEQLIHVTESEFKMLIPITGYGQDLMNSAEGVDSPDELRRFFLWGGVGAIRQFATRGSYFADDKAVGYQLGVMLMSRPFELSLRLFSWPHTHLTKTQDCGTANYSDVIAESDLEGPTTCIAAKPAFGAGIGLGYGLDFFDDWHASLGGILITAYVPGQSSR